MSLHVVQQMQINAARVAAEKKAAAELAERNRMSERVDACFERAFKRYGYSSSADFKYECVKSTLPVDQVPFP